jgi:predicted amidohydrolase YtcJ
MTRDDVTEMARLGVTASVQPAHLLDDRDVTELVWPDRADRCFALRRMVDDGVVLALGSDAPVSPLDPWLAVAAAVHRSADARPAWHPEQALTPREALVASVDGQGSVHAGARADLVLLDADPLDPAGTAAEQAARLRDMPVAATWVAGRLLHGHQASFAG